jgi:uncharacterized protein (DUF362 family)
MTCPNYSRRTWLKTAAGAAGAVLLEPRFLRAAAAPALAVSLAKCKTYDPSELLPVMAKMFDQLGGLGKLVKGKTVAIKINLTGAPTYRLGYEAAADTHYTHPAVIAAAAYLMSKAGATRIRVLESPWATIDPVEEYLLQANIEPRDIINAAPNVEFENTNWLGKAKKYSSFTCPHGGYIYPGFDLNHSFEDCDVFVSIAKLKEHATAGFTGALKNCFGSAPATVYGTGITKDGPSDEPKGGRSMFHGDGRQPPKGVPQDKQLAAGKQSDAGSRVPRIVTDIVSSRPIHLSIVEGIKTMAGGEGPWIPNCKFVQPGVIVAGLNPVNTDAVSMAVMGFDPMADRGTPPFETADSTLRLSEDIGIGTRDLKRIEVIGTPIKDALFDFSEMRKQRRANTPRRSRG